MDPVLVATVVSSLISSCTKVEQGLQSIVGRYKQSGLMISSIRAECTIIRISLSQVQHVLNSHQSEVSDPPRLDDRLGPWLDVAVAGSSLVFCAIEEELGKIGVDVDANTPVSRRARRAYTWDDSRMKEILGSIQGQQSAVTFLFVLLQTNSTEEIQMLLRVRHSSLHSIAKRTGSLREHYPRAAAYAASLLETVTDSESVFSDTESGSFALADHSMETSRYQMLPLQNLNHSSSNLTVTPEIDRSFQRISLGQSGQTRMQELVKQQKEIIMATNQIRHAIASGDTTNVAALLRQGADISTTFEYAGQTITLLHSAASHGYPEIVKLLLAYQHKIDAATPETGSTPLHVAVIKGNPAVVRLLIECGADVECKMEKQRAPGEAPVSASGAPQWVDGRNHPNKVLDDWTGFRPLHCAAIYNRPECTRHLLESGAEVDARSAQLLNTPLHLSTIFGNSDVTEILNRFGADQMALDNSGFPVFKLGRSHVSKIPPRAWGPSLHGTAVPTVPSYEARYG